MVRKTRLVLSEIVLTSWMVFAFVALLFSTFWILDNHMSHQLAAAQLINQERYHQAAMELAAWTNDGNWKDNPNFYATAALIHAHNGNAAAAEWNKNKAKELRAK